MFMKCLLGDVLGIFLSMLYFWLYFIFIVVLWSCYCFFYYIDREIEVKRGLSYVFNVILFVSDLNYKVG